MSCFSSWTNTLETRTTWWRCGLSGLRLSSGNSLAGAGIQPSVGILARTRVAPQSCSAVMARSITAFAAGGSGP